MQKSFIFLLIILFTGCTNHDLVNEDHYFNQSDDELINQAQDALKEHNYRAAVKILETFGTLYPLSQKSALVEKVLIECYYRQAEYPMLKAASDRFVYEHPQDTDVDYIKYLRFMASIKQAKNYPYDWLPTDYAKRDVSRFKECFLEGKSFILEYPKSHYAPAVAHRLPELKNIIARYYFLRGEDLYSRQQYIGAIDAYQIVLENFPDTDYDAYAQAKIEQFKRLFPKNISLEIQSS
jgi:outer membrane assembly lipoprotein YfiO